MKFIFFLISLLSLGLPSISVNVTHARGFNGLSVSQALSLFQEADSYFQLTYGYELKIKNFRSIRNPFQRLHADYANDLWVYTNWSIRLAKRRHRADINLIIAPPFCDGFMCYILGRTAPRACLHGVVSMVAMEERSLSGLDRIPHSETALLHELSRAIGASTENDPPSNLMSVTSLRYVDSGTISLLEKTRLEVLQCLQR